MRSIIRSDEAGEELYRELENTENEAVDHLVALARDDYPFEHNTWIGGVKADDVKVKKGHPLPTDEHEPEETEGNMGSKEVVTMSSTLEKEEANQV